MSNAVDKFDDEIRQIDLTIAKETKEDDILKLIAEVRPEWDKNGIEIKELEGGYINAMFLCSPLDGPSKDEKILIRVYGFKLDTKKIMEEMAGKLGTKEEGQEFKEWQNRGLEMRVMHKMSQIGICAPLYARFNNGIIYGYTPGTILDTDLIRKPDIYSKIASTLAHFHTNPPIERDDSTELGYEKMKSFHEYLPMSQAGIDEASEDEPRLKELPRMTEVLDELHEIDKEIQESKPEIAFCHSDLNMRNIIYNAETAKISFIDFELSSYSYIASDIAYHLVLFTGHIPEVYDPQLFPDRELQLQWLRAYLSEREVINGSKFEDFESKLSKLNHDVNLFLKHWQLSQGIGPCVWSLDKTQAAMFKKANLFEYGFARAQHYYKHKDERLSN